MAEKIEVDVTGKSKYEVAHQMATQMLTTIDGKNGAILIGRII